MSSGAPTARNSLNWPLKTVVSRHNSGGQTFNRGGASSACEGRTKTECRDHNGTHGADGDQPGTLHDGLTMARSKVFRMLRSLQRVSRVSASAPCRPALP